MSPLAGDPFDFGVADLAQLGREHSTPLFIYHLGVVRERIASIRRAFGPDIELLYAIKANPHVELLTGIKDELNGAEISSAGELERALAAGFPASALSFTGPAKAQESVARALEVGVGTFCVESREELDALAHLARRRRVRARVRLRINPLTPIYAHALVVGGGPSPFGIDVEALEGVVETLRQHDDALELLGTHHFVGAQCLSASALVRHVEQSVAIARRLEDEHGLLVESINLGGGFGVPRPGQRPLDLAPLGRATLRCRDVWAERTGRRPRLVFELGRYLVGPAGVYVCTVQRIKASRGETFVIVDGGIHHLLAASGVYSGGHALIAVTNLDNPGAPEQRVSVVGRLCTSFDRLAQGVSISRARVGDRLAFYPAGAYGPSASPGAFLGHPPARELVYESTAPPHLYSAAKAH